MSLFNKAVGFRTDAGIDKLKHLFVSYKCFADLVKVLFNLLQIFPKKYQLLADKLHFYPLDTENCPTCKCVYKRRACCNLPKTYLSFPCFLCQKFSVLVKTGWCSLLPVRKRQKQNFCPTSLSPWLRCKKCLLRSFWILLLLCCVVWFF